MGELENKSKKKAKRVRVEQIILSTLSVAGVAALALTAPNALKLLKDADPNWLLKRDPRRRLRETLSRMKRKGLIRFESLNGKNVPRLTLKGQRESRSIRLGLRAIPKPLRWDEKWRIVIFDIAEDKKGLREKVRRLVAGMGFFRLQDSVWVYPYDCEEIVALLKIDLQIGRELIYIIADAIEFDRPLRQHYKLRLD